MQVIVAKITDFALMNKACGYTINKQNVAPDPYKMYKSEHSPIRTQMFVVEMIDIPTFVSAHFARHPVGITHFVKSNRADRPSYTGDTGRNHPVNHMMLANAQALINMARKRLCNKASTETIRVMLAIKNGVALADPALAKAMVKDCDYRGDCHELRPCRQHCEAMERELNK